MAEGVKYQFLNGDGNIVLGKKRNFGAITIQKSKTAFVIAHTKEGFQQVNTNKAVGILVDYFKSLDM